tara:strand:- start:130 stop:381 length:252 start_codon:yes stop_codon:yes gene_type:complete
MFTAFIAREFGERPSKIARTDVLYRKMEARLEKYVNALRGQKLDLRVDGFIIYSRPVISHKLDLLGVASSHVKKMESTFRGVK